VTVQSKNHIEIAFETDSKLWKWLDEGVPDMVVTNPKGMTYLPRTKTRTRKHRLEVEAEAEYGLHLVHLPQGYTRFGYEGRQWTQEAARRATEHFQGKYPGLTLSLTIAGPTNG
jgi:hypothetical protein